MTPAVPGSPPELRSLKGAKVLIAEDDPVTRTMLDDMLRAEGIHTDFMRIRGFPFNGEVRAFLGRHDHTFVIEQNRDAQLRSLIGIELGFARDQMIPILDYGGMPLTAKKVVDAVKTHLAGVPV